MAFYVIFGLVVYLRVSVMTVLNLCMFAGAYINKADDYGRTPLHVAASADYPEMVRFLVDNGAEVKARTAAEDQTPLHYAAKNEAVQCVKILLAYGADIDVRDYKLRTPLQVSSDYQALLSKAGKQLVRNRLFVSPL